MSENKTASNGVGFFGLLTLVFIVLKLIGVINWAWWVVLAPAWGSFALFLVIVLIGATIAWYRYKHGL